MPTLLRGTQFHWLRLTPALAVALFTDGRRQRWHIRLVPLRGSTLDSQPHLRLTLDLPASDGYPEPIAAAIAEAEASAPDSAEARAWLALFRAVLDLDARHPNRPLDEKTSRGEAARTRAGCPSRAANKLWTSPFLP